MIQNQVLMLFAFVILGLVLPNSLAIKCNTVAKDEFRKCDIDGDNCIYMEETEAEGDFTSCLWWRVGGLRWEQSDIGVYNLTAKGGNGETTYVIKNWTGLANTYQGWEGMGSTESCDYFKDFDNANKAINKYMYGLEEGTRLAVSWSEDVKMYSDGTGIDYAADVSDGKCCNTDNCNHESKDTPLGFSITAANIGKELGAASVLLNSVFVIMFSVMAVILALP